MTIISNKKMSVFSRYKIQVKYLMHGVLFGVLFPAFAWIYEFKSTGLTISHDSIMTIIENNPLIIMINTAPFFLGLFALFGGMNQAKVQKEKEMVTQIKELLHEKSTKLEKINEKLRSEIIERKKMQERIKYLAYHDYLTGLPNRLLFTKKLESAICKSRKTKEIFAVMFLDLDNFKRVNDTMGHVIGDELLKDVAVRVTNVLRLNDTLARIGGDEYVIILENINDISYAEVIAKKICNTLSRVFKVGGKEVFISVSIGISIFPFDGQDSDMIIKHADIAMYNVKDKGKNKHMLYTSYLKENIGETLN